MNQIIKDHASFALLALCICQSCAITTGTSTTYIYCNEHLVKGHAKALEGDWEKAALLWNQLANAGSNSACAKAAFNMVIASEMLNRRDMAIKWAQKTISDYKYPIARKRAKDYLSMLHHSDFVSCE
jgi:hypothetical protein